MAPLRTFLAGCSKTHRMSFAVRVLAHRGPELLRDLAQRRSEAIRNLHQPSYPGDLPGRLQGEDVADPVEPLDLQAHVPGRQPT